MFRGVAVGGVRRWSASRYRPAVLGGQAAGHLPALLEMRVEDGVHPIQELEQAGILHAVMDVEALLAGGYQPGAFQDRQMARDVGLLLLDGRKDLAHAPFAIPKEFQDRNRVDWPRPLRAAARSSTRSSAMEFLHEHRLATTYRGESGGVKRLALTWAKAGARGPQVAAGMPHVSGLPYHLCARNE